MMVNYLQSQGYDHSPVTSQRTMLAMVLGYVVFLMVGTGFATDDYVHFVNGLSRSITDHLLPKEYISVPVLHYTHALAYFVFGDRLWAYDLLKAVYAGMGVYFSSRFFGLFCPPRHSLLLAFLFIFSPLHDGATFWLTGLYLVLSFSAYLFAYALGAVGNARWAIAFAFLGSFSSYGSTPIAIGLTVLALLQRKRLLAAQLMGPNLVYIAYYLSTSLLLNAGTQRLTGEVSIVGVGKQFALQAATFIDASVGPSAWLKIYYSVGALDGAGVLSGLVMATIFIRYTQSESRLLVTRHLVVAAIVILVASFAMFALTGLYPQLAFSLGNRVMIYGGFFLACLFAALRFSRNIEIVLILLLLLSITGVSTHWKRWHEDLQLMGKNIRENSAILQLEQGSQLFVSGHQYSRLGPYCHIDFFTADYVVSTYLRLQLGAEMTLRPASFNRRLILEDGVLRDRKYGVTKQIGNGIWVYDSHVNILHWIPKSEIPARLTSLPDETRHWTQQLGEGWFKQRLLEAVPRLRYAY